MAATTKSRNRNITKADLQATERLRRIWDQQQRARKFNQTDAGAEMGMTQGAVSQYLTGRIALGPVATLKFAKYLGCNPLEIRPDLTKIGIEPGALTIDAIRLAFHWQENLDPDVQEAVAKFIFSIPPKGKKIA